VEFFNCSLQVDVSRTAHVRLATFHVINRTVDWAGQVLVENSMF